MQQLLHILAVSPSGNVLAQSSRGRWLLPVLACAESTRAPVAVDSWLRDRGLPGFVVGQWKGRIGPAGSSIDWLVVVSLPGEGPPQSPCSWLRIDGLRSSDALIEYDGWAIDAVTANGGIGVAGPFGTFTWIDEVTAWVSIAVGSRCVPSACFRASSHEVAVAYSCRASSVFFKGLAADSAHRAIVETEAARVAPASFPRTIAHERRGDGSIWRLTARCTGEPLVRVLDERSATRAAADVARLQRGLQYQPGLVSALPAVELDRLRMVMVSLLARHDAPDVPAEIDAALDEVASIEAGWTPLDLDPVNIFISERALQYFDLDAHLAAPPLAIAIWCRRLRRSADRGKVRLRERVLDAYGDSWQCPVPWAVVAAVSEVVELTMGWERVQRNAARGELTGELRTIERRIACRLTEVLRRKGAQSIR